MHYAWYTVKIQNFSKYKRQLMIIHNKCTKYNLCNLKYAMHVIYTFVCSIILALYSRHIYHVMYTDLVQRVKHLIYK